MTKIKIFENYRIYIDRKLMSFKKGEQEVNSNIAKILIDKKAAKAINLVESVKDKISGKNKEEKDKDKKDKKLKL
jgi:hypothetical protein